MASLDGVEIKASLGTKGIEPAMERFGLTWESGTRRTIWFCEAAPTEKSTTPLGDRHVVVRLRRAAGDGDSDSTVKIRPFTPPLPSPWDHYDGDDQLKVEGDWTGESHPDSASLVSTQPGPEIDAAVDGRSKLATVLSGDQERFFARYAGDIGIHDLRALGPIDAVKWKPEGLGFRLDVAVEHWAVDDLRFLELSIRTGHPGEAVDLQAEFAAFLRQEGLLEFVEGATKTSTVLDHLARR
ncbi:MAG TPA: hypothetical protein VFJ85_03830 [Acidimicrobiales bacterium]|nr:hypothetical protein [Acidimicrobiales bacterium]